MLLIFSQVAALKPKQPSSAMFFGRPQCFMVRFCECLEKNLTTSVLDPNFTDFPEICSPLLYAFLGIINLAGLQSKVQRPRFFHEQSSQSMKISLDLDSRNPTGLCEKN